MILGTLNTSEVPVLFMRRKIVYDFSPIDEALGISCEGSRLVEDEFEGDSGSEGMLNGFYGKRHTEETKRIIGEKSKLYPKEWKTNYGEANGMYGSARFGDLNPMWGKKQSEETRRKISEANKGKPAYNKGVPCPKATKEALSTKNSRIYTMTNPCGEVTTIHNLSKFCSDNDLSEACMRHVIAGRNKSHKGWTL